MVQSHAVASNSSKVLPWHDVVVARLDHVCQLRTGWDGYDARPVDIATADFALRLLESLCSSSPPAPSIVPGVSGDLQIEWHTAAWDVEIHVLASDSIEAWRRSADRHGAEEETIEAPADLARLRDWLKTLAEPAFADHAPAAR